jgi:hypothetical protein
MLTIILVAALVAVAWTATSRIEATFTYWD